LTARGDGSHPVRQPFDVASVAMCLAPSQTILSTDEAGAVAPPIFTSVGQDAVNGPGDVFVIQSLLNRRLPKPHTEVPVTGTMDPGTILAIKAFQAVMMNMNPPTGYVAPGSPTYYALAARPLVTKEQAPTPRFGHVGIIPPEIIEAAKASLRRWGIPASITLAQWIVESAWGAAMPPDSNNPFGIKALEGQPAVESETREVIDGKVLTVTARFRRFASMSEAFELHGKLLSTGSPYRAAMEVVKDPDRFADALTGVYATDPQYGTTLKWVMDNYRLKQYD
jgi:peptidoglycan hydrolase-like protein with peptidoglycan-binding domain